jgi:hypothetical protein
MATALDTYLDPAAYSEEAVAAARAGDISTLNNDLRIVRLACALHDDDLDASKGLIEILDDEILSGHALFKARTGALLLAAREGDQVGFDRALVSWIAGREAWPNNWIDDVLNAPELRPMLSSLHPVLLKQREIARRTLTHAELIFIKDLSFVIIRAVQDNLEWLRAADPKATISDLADKYRLTSVDLDLCEATLEGHGAMPDLIVALDHDGGYTGSFIAH